MSGQRNQFEDPQRLQEAALGAARRALAEKEYAHQKDETERVAGQLSVVSFSLSITRRPYIPVAPGAPARMSHLAHARCGSFVFTCQMP